MARKESESVVRYAAAETKANLCELPVPFRRYTSASSDEESQMHRAARQSRFMSDRA